MTAKVINLRRARKGKTRQARRDKAAVKTGEPAPASTAKLDEARHEGHRLTQDPPRDRD